MNDVLEILEAAVGHHQDGSHAEVPQVDDGVWS